MAVLWQMSLIPQIDPSGDPYSGMKAYFFEVSTTTPQIVYTDAALSIPHDHPVVANSAGRFPAVFFTEGSSHRLRTTTAADVTIDDVDGISVPTVTPIELPDSNTPVEKTVQTGHIIMAWRASAPTGFVRLNGRTIGSASSGATERANADCEDLFTYLYNNDTNLSVSGGRGANAAGDWAANKQISLPDWRGRIPVGPDSFGNSAANRVTDAVLGADSDLLGAVGGAQTHTLVEGELPAITPAGTIGNESAHTHGFTVNARNNTGDGSGALTGGQDIGVTDGSFSGTTAAGSAHNHTFTGTPFGSDDPHNNMQPSIVCPFFIKL